LSILWNRHRRFVCFVVLCAWWEEFKCGLDFETHTYKSDIRYTYMYANHTCIELIHTHIHTYRSCRSYRAYRSFIYS
jgi:hypothetical protein